VTREPLTLDAFADYLGGRLDLAPGVLDPDADVRTELHFDSIQMFVLVVAVEDLGVLIPERLMPHLRTVRDAYTQYCNSLAHRG
jgi:acyl carrier protein